MKNTQELGEKYENTFPRSWGGNQGENMKNTFQRSWGGNQGLAVGRTGMGCTLLNGEKWKGAAGAEIRNIWEEI